MTYEELERLQRLPLKQKMDRAVEWIGKGLDVSKHNTAIAFSGGKDSTVLWWLIRTFYPDARPFVIFGNTGVEYPESLRFARKLGKEWGEGRFYEARPEKLEKDGLKYEAQREVLAWLEKSGRLGEVLQDDGKLKTTELLESKATPKMWEDFRRRDLVWRKGTTKSYWWCVDQYGFPILGKSKCKLDAHRINIDCFLRFSKSQSENAELLSYYDLIRQVKISQHCCKLLKKDPSERMQAELDVDVIFKGLMAAESRTRATSYMTRGELFQSSRPHLGDDPFFHCNPMGCWTDEDVWQCIEMYDIPVSELYSRGYTGPDGKRRTIQRNGCYGCATGIAFADNQLAMLRKTHPALWEQVMRSGMAEQLKALRIARANGQTSLLDLFTAEELMEIRPCAFDSVDRIIMHDDSMGEYDSEVEDS